MDITDMSIAELSALILEEMRENMDAQDILSDVKKSHREAARAGDTWAMEIYGDAIYDFAGDIAMRENNVEFLMEELSERQVAAGFRVPTFNV